MPDVGNVQDEVNGDGGIIVIYIGDRGNIHFGFRNNGGDISYQPHPVICLDAN